MNPNGVFGQHLKLIGLNKTEWPNKASNSKNENKTKSEDTKDLSNQSLVYTSKPKKQFSAK